MGSKNTACSVLRSIWSCTKDETKSLTAQKSEFAFSALGSCWRWELLSTVQQCSTTAILPAVLLSGSTVVILRWQGSVFTQWLSQPLTLQPFPLLPCVLAHPRTVVGPSFRHSSSPTRGCLCAGANHQIPLILLLPFLVESLEGYRLPLPVPDTHAQAQLPLLPCVTSSGDCIQIVCVQWHFQTLPASPFNFLW